MSRTIFIEEHFQTYFHNIAKQDTCTIGLILGQSIAGKDYIIHFAKTPPYQPDNTENTTTIKNIEDFNEGWIADHARHVTRMLPGGFYVLGIFIVSPDDLLSSSSGKIKTILLEICSVFDSNNYLFGNVKDFKQKLVLTYNRKTEQFSSKHFDSSQLKPAEIKFISKNVNKLSQFECKYEIDEVYHIQGDDKDWPLKTHMNIILDEISKSLTNSVFLFDGDIKNETELIENISKKKKVSRSGKGSHQETNQENSKPIQVSIFQSCTNRNSEIKFKINEFSSQIRIVGQVNCKVWLNSKASFNLASEAIREDIMRSLSTRLEMHWDSLTEEEHGEDINSVHEPPRRVLAILPHSNIKISDYLFPGEGPQDAQESFEEMFDIKIHHNKLEVEDVEGQAELTDYYNEPVDSECDETISKLPNNKNKLMYFISLGFAILVLIISLVIHFIQQ